MNQLIQKWREFKEWWAEHGKRTKTITMGDLLQRPFLDDFMDWLAEEELKDKE